MCAQQSDIHIARKADKKPIGEIADKLNIPNKYQYPYGHYTCKIDLKWSSIVDLFVSTLST